MNLNKSDPKKMLESVRELRKLLNSKDKKKLVSENYLYKKSYTLFGRKPNVEKIKAKGNLKGLIKALNYKNDQHIRKAAAEALGYIGDTSAIKYHGGKSAIVHMNKYRDLMEVARFDEVHAVREAATKAIIKIGKPALPQLIDVLQPRTLQQASIIGPFESIAAYIIGEIGNPLAVDTLLHAHFRGVGNASEALVKIGSAATPGICNSLWKRAGGVWSHSDLLYGRPLFDILGQIGDHRGVVPLLKYIKQSELKKDPLIYPFLKEARQALKMIVKGKEVELFSDALNDNYWLVRVAAAEELGKTKDSEAVAALREALTNKVDEVCEAAKKALNRLNY